jgi:predicted nucleic acid-binding protein
MEKNRESVIIADTSGLISLFLPDDHNHKVALQAAKALQSAHRDIIIPPSVFVEFLNILGRIAGHKTARAVVPELTPPFMVLTKQTNLHQALKKFETLPQSVSFTDCLVMATADEYETRDIFGFDKQFQDAGYNRLEPSTEWR